MRKSNNIVAADAYGLALNDKAATKSTGPKLGGGIASPSPVSLLQSPKFLPLRCPLCRRTAPSVLRLSATAEESMLASGGRQPPDRCGFRANQGADAPPLASTISLAPCGLLA